MLLAEGRSRSLAYLRYIYWDPAHTYNTLPGIYMFERRASGNDIWARLIIGLDTRMNDPIGWYTLIKWDGALLDREKGKLKESYYRKA